MFVGESVVLPLEAKVLYHAVFLIEPSVFAYRDFLAIGLVVAIVDVLVIEPNNGFAEAEAFSDVGFQLSLPLSVGIILQGEFGDIGRLEDTFQRLELE